LVHFSQPIWAVRDGFIVLSGNPKNLIDYEAVAHHPTATLGVVVDQMQEKSALEVGIPVGRIKLFRKQDAIIEALLAGQVDAYVTTSIGIRAYLERLNNPQLEAVNFPTGPHSPVFPGAFSFAKSNNALYHPFNARLASFLGSDAHLAIAHKHGFSEIEIEPVLKYGPRLRPG
jgi:polar amino acid transport system substrate-binding protein